MPQTTGATGWKLLEAQGPAGFVTLEVWRRPNGLLLGLSSRWRRKHSPRLNPRSRTARGSVCDALWAPRRTTWWIGLLFAIGASCFLVLSVPGFSEVAGAVVAGRTFFVGSVFFTLAAYLQFFEAINAGVESGPWVAAKAGDDPPPIMLFAVRPRSLGYWATLVQFVGTIAFNATTWAALDGRLSAGQYDAAVWRPDLFGSICFLVASYLAWAEVCHSYWRLSGRGTSWWIAAINMTGSVAFGVSGVAAYQSPVSGRAVSAAADDLGTLAGGICFLAGALLLWPETVEEPVARRVVAAT